MRIDGQQTARRRTALTAGEHENAAQAIDVRRNRRRVARTPLVARAPNQLPALFVECRHGGPARGAYIHDQQIALDQRRGGDSKKILRDFELGRQIALPIHLSGFQLQAVQFAFRAVGVHAVAVDHRAGARTVVVPVAVLKLGGVAELPIPLAGLAMEAFDPLFFSGAVHKKH